MIDRLQQELMAVQGNPKKAKGSSRGNFRIQLPRLKFIEMQSTTVVSKTCHGRL
jgi:hypothetical protein